MKKATEKFHKVSHHKPRKLGLVMCAQKKYEYSFSVSKFSRLAFASAKTEGSNLKIMKICPVPVLKGKSNCWNNVIRLVFKKQKD